jgi:hypothetical protein
MKAKRVAVMALISAAMAMPLGGFVFGFMHCDDCGFDLLGRGFIGLVSAVLTPLSGGFPPQNEGGVGPPFNAWPHIVVTWTLLFAWLVYLSQKKSKKKGPIQSPQTTPVSAPR